MKCVWNVPKYYSIRIKEGLTKYILFGVTTFRIIKKSKYVYWQGTQHHPRQQETQVFMQMNTQIYLYRNLQQFPSQIAWLPSWLQYSVP